MQSILDDLATASGSAGKRVRKRKAQASRPAKPVGSEAAVQAQSASDPAPPVDMPPLPKTALESKTPAPVPSDSKASALIEPPEPPIDFVAKWGAALKQLAGVPVDMKELSPAQCMVIDLVKRQEQHLKRITDLTKSFADVVPLESKRMGTFGVVATERRVFGQPVLVEMPAFMSLFEPGRETTAALLADLAIQVHESAQKTIGKPGIEWFRVNEMNLDAKLSPQIIAEAAPVLESKLGYTRSEAVKLLSRVCEYSLNMWSPTGPNSMGRAIYRVASFMNYSCEPNTVEFFSPNGHLAIFCAKGVIKAKQQYTRFASPDQGSRPKGTRIGDIPGYGPHDAGNGRPIYHCACELCGRGKPSPTLTTGLNKQNLALAVLAGTSETPDIEGRGKRIARLLASGNFLAAGHEISTLLVDLPRARMFYVHLARQHPSEQTRNIVANMKVCIDRCNDYYLPQLAICVLYHHCEHLPAVGIDYVKLAQEMQERLQKEQEKKEAAEAKAMAQRDQEIREAAKKETAMHVDPSSQGGSGTSVESKTESRPAAGDDDKVEDPHPVDECHWSLATMLRILNLFSTRNETWGTSRSPKHTLQIMTGMVAAFADYMRLGYDMELIKKLPALQGLDLAKFMADRFRQWETYMHHWSLLPFSDHMGRQSPVLLKVLTIASTFADEKSLLFKDYVEPD